MAITCDQIDAMAPDAKSIAAGRKLAKPATWSGLGQSGAALWGECTGSSVYQVRVDLSDTAYGCSCPSRKLPCKHVLALLYLSALSPEALPSSGAPEWVSGQEEFLAEGERAVDAWLVAAQSIGQEERLRVQRTWLLGTTTGRTALDLQFSAAGQPFGQLFALGSAVRGELAFWPSACPQRARFVTPPETLSEMPVHLPGMACVDAYATDLARLPWLDEQLFCLKETTVFRQEAAFAATTGDGKALPLSATLAYGESTEEAIGKVQALARRILAGRTI